MAAPAESEPEDEPHDEEGGSVNLDDLTKSELMGYAAEEGIDLNMKMTKQDMIDIFEKNENGAE